MINGLIYWSGVITLIGVFGLVSVWAYWNIFEKLLDSKKYFVFLVNNASNKHLKEMKDEEFEEWVENLRLKHRGFKDKPSFKIANRYQPRKTNIKNPKPPKDD